MLSWDQTKDTIRSLRQYLWTLNSGVGRFFKKIIEICKTNLLWFFSFRFWSSLENIPVNHPKSPNTTRSMFTIQLNSWCYWTHRRTNCRVFCWPIIASIVGISAIPHTIFSNPNRKSKPNFTVCLWNCLISLWKLLLSSEKKSSLCAQRKSFSLHFILSRFNLEPNQW